MSALAERQDAGRLLDGIENGSLTPTDAAMLAERIDPVLVYAIVSLLRAIHPASDPAAQAVLERVVKLTTASPAVIRKHRDGEEDPISRWFESEYNYRDFRGRGTEMIELLVDKIES
jgi:hypothetical protein